MKKLLLLVMVIGLLMTTTSWAEPRWVQELRQNGTWSVEKPTPKNLRGDAIALYRIYHPEPDPLQSPEGYWYVGNGSPESISTPVIEKNKYIGSGGGWGWNHHRHRHHRSRV